VHATGSVQYTSGVLLSQVLLPQYMHLQKYVLLHDGDEVAARAALRGVLQHQHNDYARSRVIPWAMVGTTHLMCCYQLLPALSVGTHVLSPVIMSSAERILVPATSVCSAYYSQDSLRELIGRTGGSAVVNSLHNKMRNYTCDPFCLSETATELKAHAIC
jgi:hypothetical protein